MAKVFIEESTLTDIGDAIRSKTGDANKLSPASMVTAIKGITAGEGGLPEEALKITGSMDYAFYEGAWTWFAEIYGDKVSTDGITGAYYAFKQNQEIEKIPFEFNFNNEVFHSAEEMFSECFYLKEIGAFNDFRPSNMNRMFLACSHLRYLPEFRNADFRGMHNSRSGRLKDLFLECNSLREIPEYLLCQLYTSPDEDDNNLFTWMGICSLYVLDELVGLYPPSGIRREACINAYYLFRIKEFRFALQEDGTPYTRNWVNQIIDLTDSGYCARTDENKCCITGYNSGITEDKEVTDKASYNRLKDNPDWYTHNYEFSRYNHDSAVNTLNSLPDTIEFLETMTSGSNSIVFKGNAGIYTDGGAINTLTEEELAPALAKGWSIGYR